MIYKYIVFIASLMLSASLIAQSNNAPQNQAKTQTNPADQAQRLIALEKSLFKAQEELLNAKAELVKEQQNHKREEHKLFMQVKDQTFTKHIIFVLGGVLLGALGFMLMALKMMKSEVKKRIEHEVNNNMKHLSRVVDNSRLETRLKSETRILVLYNKKDNNNLSSILKNFNFINTDDMPCPSSPADVNWNEYDQVIFDHVEEDILKDYVAFKPNQWFLLYNSGRSSIEFVRKHQLSLANTKITLYPRLIELLSWKHSQG